MTDFDRLVGPDRRTIPRPTGLGLVILGLAILVIVGMVVLWPRGEPDIDYGILGFADDTAPARVTAAVIGECPQIPDYECSLVELEITGGPHAGEIVTDDFVVGQGQPNLSVGDRVFLSVLEHPDGSVSFQYAD